MVHHTVSLSIAPQEEVKNTMVKVIISYPKDWKGAKHFNEGDIKEVSPETAQHFISLGIASEGDTVRKPQKSKK
jgi:hypothetical protein